MLLKTRRLVLRKLRTADAEALHKAMSCPQVHDMYSNGFDSIDRVESYIRLIESEYARGKHRTLAVADGGTDALIGAVTLDVFEPCKRAEFSYWIAKERRNHGCGTETVTALIAHCFNRLGLHRVQATTSNPASERVLIKSGMEYEGTLRGYFASDGAYRDAKIYAAVNDEQ